MRTFFIGVLGLAIIAVVASGGLYGLSGMEAAQPSCGDRAMVVFPADEARFNSKWAAFDAALKKGEPATATFSEEEITARGARYLADNGIPARNLQVHLCPGIGEGQATMTLDVMGREVSVLVTGHLDVTQEPPRIVVESAQLGQIHDAIGTPMLNALLGATSLTAPVGLSQATTTSSTVTLEGN